MASVLAGHAQSVPSAPFLLYEAEPGKVQTTSYAEAYLRARRMAGALARNGIRAGDRFNVHLTNSPAFYDLWFAAAIMGAAIIPSNPLSTAGELRYQISNSGCELTVTQADLFDTAKASGVVKCLSIEDDWVKDDDDLTPVEVSPQVPLGVLYTSGTTSRPKGVIVTHSAYLHVGDVVAGHLRLRPDDRQLIVLPLFHGNAQYYSTMSALVSRASIALTPRFSASRWSEQAALLEATVASLFAAPIRMILAQDPTPYDAAHRLRAAMFAQNVTVEQLDAFETRFNVPLLQLYGMTETVVPPTMNPLYGERRGLSIGRPVLGAQIRVVDEADKDLPPGVAGELLVHGEPGRTLMASYLDNPAATAETLRNGWLHTGDTVTYDADGYLSFVDRRKDLIKRAGENIASTEVEQVLNSHPGVYESAVIGVPDAMRDESVKAFCVLHEEALVTEEALIEHCRQRLAKFKIPDSIEFVTELPRTSVGKIQKHLLGHPKSV